MNNYTIFCTEEQTCKAFKLGAPIEIWDTEVDIEDRNIGCTVGYERFWCRPAKIENYLYKDNGDRREDVALLEGSEETGRIIVFSPTAEQIIGWIEEQESIDDIEIYKINADWRSEVFMADGNYIRCFNFSSRKEATLAAIDAALEYLTNNKK